MSNQEEPQERGHATSGSGWSLRVATLAGIPVRIHITFLLLIAYFAHLGQKTPQGWLPWVLFALGMFACVVLHEFGHALTAKRYGIRTRDITLYPIGGVAMFEGRMRPHQEFWIALAGPAVNVVIAILLGVYYVLFKGGIPWLAGDFMSNGILYAIFISNISLAVFNLIPAFPMDGGRVLRAGLALFMDEAKATAIAGTVGQLMAVVLGFLGFLSVNVLLILVAFFVYMGAGQEMAATATRRFLEGHRLREAMQTRFRTIESGASLQTAAEMLLAGSQHDFPVVAGDEVVGILTRTEIARGLATDGPTGYVAGHMNRDITIGTPDMPMEEALELFSRPDATPILIMDRGELIGMVTQENLSEFIMLQSALRDRRA